jgi:hypothetical protein
VASLDQRMLAAARQAQIPIAEAWGARASPTSTGSRDGSRRQESLSSWRKRMMIE